MESVSITKDEFPKLDSNTLDFIARTFAALGDPTRCRIVYALVQDEISVNELAAFVGASVSAVSHHLARLHDQRVVKKRREGKHVYYSIDDAHVGRLFIEALHHLDHVRENLPDHGSVL